MFFRGVFSFMRACLSSEDYLFSDPRNRPIRFQVVFAALLSIKPTSTEPERAFSIMGYFCTKIRNRLSDEALDAMVFMRQYLKNQREKKRSSQNSHL